MRIIIPSINLPKFRTKKTGRVFRFFKRLDDGSFLIAGHVDRYRTGRKYERK